MLLSISRLRIHLVAHKALEGLGLVVLAEVVLDIARFCELSAAVVDDASVDHLSVACL